MTKKLFFYLLTVFTTISIGMKAQISSYTFSAVSGTYTDISGGTPVATSTSVADFLGDYKTSVSLPIGFTFNYNGINYTNLIAASDGFVTFNTTGTSITTNDLATGASRPLLAPLWDDLDGASGSGAATYITTGSAPNRVFTMEWKNWQWNYNATGATISFQVKLYEGTNVIEFHYRQESGAVNSGSASIGINGVSTGSGNYLSLNGTGTSPTASSTSETITLSTKPATGQIYRFTPATCFSPTAVTSSAITTNSATISWTAASPAPANGYSYYYSTSSTAPSLTAAPSGTTAAGVTSTNISLLAPGTTYYVWVRSRCSATDSSSWSSVYSFSTLCASSSIPYVQGFNGTSIPTCWSKQLITATATKISFITSGTYPTTSPSEGSHFVMYNSYSSTGGGAGAEERLNSIPLNASTIATTVDVQFMWRAENNASYSTGTYVTGEGVQVQYSINNGVTWTNAGSFISRHDGTLTAGTAAWKLKTITLPSAANVSNLLVSFKFISAWGDNLFMDAVDIHETPTCVAPSGLATTSVTTTSANISWTAPSTAPGSGYEYYYSTSSTAPTATSTPSGATAAGVTTASLSPLLANTVYYVWVRSACDATLKSAWTPSISFLTGYCIPSASGTETYINNFSTTGGTTSNISNLASGFTTGGYQNNSSTMSVSTYATGVFNFNFAIVGGSVGAAIWVDWNNNLIFEASERLFNTSSYSNGPFTGNITVPAGTVPGDYRMRVLIDYNTSVPTNACGFGGTRGEVEDYKLTVTPPPPIPACFTGTPSPANGSSACISTTATTFSWSAVADATSYEVYLSTAGGSPVLVNTVTTTSYTSTAALPAGVYTWYILPKNVSGTASGCTNYTFTVNALPTIAVSPTSSSMCSDNTTPIALTASGASTYTWLPVAGLSTATGATVNALPTATTTYTATGTDANGCQASASSTITVNPTPTVISTNITEDLICEGEVLMLTASGAAIPNSGTIGTGTTAPSATLFPNPLSSYYGGAKHQMIYTVAELNALGFSTNSSINSVGLHVFAAGSSTNTLTNLTIRIGHIGTSSLSGFVTGNMDVYGPTTWTPSVAGWSDFTLTSPFTWNGTSNIVVEFVYNGGNGGNGSGTRVTTTTTSSNMTYYGAKDYAAGGIAGFDTVTVFGTSGASTSRPNLRLFGTANAPKIWSPNTELYTNSGATVAYDGTSSKDTLYAKPTISTTYTISATTAAGCSRSSNIDVEVSPNVAITTDLNATESACVGTDVVLSISADNASIYQWRKGGVVISGVTGNTLTLSDISLTDAGEYDVIAVNDGGCNDTSIVCTLTVNENAAIASVSPTSISVCAGESIEITATATNATSYIWMNGTSVIAGATSNVLEIASAALADAGTYSVIAVNTNGCNDTMSDAAIITVNAVAEITTQPAGETICEGNAYTLMGVASGATSYQWLKDDVAVASATATTLELTGTIAESGSYQLVAINAAGCNDTSDVALVTFNATPAITATSTNNTSCAAPNGSITISAAALINGASYIVSIDGSSVGTFTANAGAIVLENMDAGTYNDIEITTADGCNSNVITSVTISGTPSGDGAVTPTTNSSTATLVDADIYTYFDGSCNVIATVNATDGDLGLVTAQAVVEPTAGVYNGAPYLQRHFEITAENNTIPAEVTVYVLASEVANYNANNDTFPDMDATLSNVKVTAYHNEPGTGAGPNGHEPADAELISTVTANFNSTANRWELTFTTSGFSGFYIHTTSSETPLNIQMGNASAHNQGNSNIVKWNSLDESSASHFVIQRSQDARTFSNIAKEQAIGKASNYVYNDNAPFKGANHYRIVMVDNNGNEIHSKTVTAIVQSGNHFAMSAFPNPTKNNVTLSIEGTKGTDAKVFVTDVTGKIVYQVNEIATTQVAIPMENLPQGVYLIKYTDSENTSTVKVTKQ